jgi:hypothetical protein
MCFDVKTFASMNLADKVSFTRSFLAPLVHSFGVAGPFRLDGALRHHCALAILFKRYYGLSLGSSYSLAKACCEVGFSCWGGKIMFLAVVPASPFTLSHDVKAVRLAIKSH